MYFYLKKFINLIDYKKIKFVIVGGLTFFVYYFLIYLMLEIFKIDHYLTISIAYFIAVCFHFFSNKLFTFEIYTSVTINEIARYVAFSLFSYILQLIFLRIFFEKFQLNIYFVIFLALLINIVLSFFTMKYWIFTRSLK